ncbi:hypothetical protein EYF80_067869 [Liparis tanakae]|uniref:Uncharacterized protein n=1 Tax=Liparis tanakae TaxID=230148 RepID=A0A4Z2DZX5_9TELE|nr:hypothetical protein EYF80_067869 [Liparis tanakae]
MGEGSSSLSDTLGSSSPGKSCGRCGRMPMRDAAQ